MCTLPSTHPIRSPWLALAAALLAGCGGADSGAKASTQDRPPAPVAVAELERRPITLRRVFSGALEATARVRVAPRVPGQVARLDVDIGDPVARGQVVAALDDRELSQALAQAEAEASVARANQSEAEAAAEIASREFQRVKSLREQGVASEAELDAARSTALARSSRREVTAAQVTRAEAVVEAARIRLADTRITVDWEDVPSGDDAGSAGTRLVAARFVDEGAIVAAGEPVVSVVALDPIVAVISVPERDYRSLSVGQTAALDTDAYPGETFTGRVARIAPVFQSSTRQVRVELEVRNQDLRLKPGMFVRARLELRREADAAVVPYAALTRRGDANGVFVVQQDGAARWELVTPGIREGDLVELVGATFEGPVVTLGQEMCSDGEPVKVIQGAGR